MSGNDAKILVDLNHPGFQAELFDMDVSEVKKAFKTLKKLRSMTWNDVFRDHGLKWEELKSFPGKFTIRHHSHAEP